MRDKINNNHQLKHDQLLGSLREKIMKNINDEYTNSSNNHNILKD